MPLDVTLPHGEWLPREYQKPVWRYFDEGGKRASLIWHRRAGKDDVILHRFAMEALAKRVGTYWHLLPTHEQARKALWRAVNPHTGRRRIHDAFPRELIKRELDQEMIVEFVNGSTYQVFGSDNFDAAVGSSPVGIAFSEWALAKPEAWGVFSPMLVENNGWAAFITTPRGRNHAAEMHFMAEENPDWFAEVLTVDDTGAIPADALEQDRQEKIALFGEELGQALFDQEWWCTFDTPSDRAFIPSYLATRAAQRFADEVYRWDDVKDRECVIGVDVARYGADRSVIFRRRGPLAYAPQVFESISNTDLAGVVAEEVDQHKPDALFIDAGRGEGVIDRLRAMGYRPVEVNFGGQANRQGRYFNRRAEMWARMKEWISAGGALPQDHALKTDLATPEYVFDNKDRLKLESKEDIKKRGARSPDLADALALTFAARPRTGDATGPANRTNIRVTRAFSSAKQRWNR